MQLCNVYRKLCFKLALRLIDNMFQSDTSTEMQILHVEGKSVKAWLHTAFYTIVAQSATVSNNIYEMFWRIRNQ